ncbi:hypothetical protein U8P75_25705 (plasmid) [Rhizobium beringeri]|nr:hypothetical protein U8P75_25705 [Rhizobium beringeri]
MFEWTPALFRIPSQPGERSARKLLPLHVARLDAFDKSDMIEMLDKPEHIAFRIAERIEPSAPLMRNDDDFTATAKLDRPPAAFLDVDGRRR